MSYLQKYTELEVIGRGNFGAAYLVIHKAENAKYVAKKMILGALTDKEYAGAMQESELLRRLNHPNIVTYKETFIENQVLIIIMEYCEVGDLAFQIKQRNKSGEIFTETEIMNWFVQICMALNYIHTNHILHRDIKSSNIYLTGNNIVKLGDFGISRVLEGSIENARTVVGTPYYMSPEVCQSHPYTYKSDIWSLGCVIYELCTLQHAFRADNLLGLAYKIVTDKADPIPSRYSPELRRLVQVMLIKDAASRPSSSQLLTNQFVQQYMHNFVDTGGQSLSNVRSLNVKRTHTYEAEKQAATRQPAPTNETPQQARLRRKLEEADRKAEELKRATRESFIQKDINKQRKVDELYSSPDIRNRHAYLNAPRAEISASGSTIANIEFDSAHSWERRQDDPYYDDDFEDSLGYSITSNSDYPLYQNPEQERPIHSSGSYDLNFSQFSDYEEITDDIAQGNPQEVTQVLENYRTTLQHVPEPSSPDMRHDRSEQSLAGNASDRLRQKCIQQLGPERFQQIYDFMVARQNAGVDENIMAREIKERYGRDAYICSMNVATLIYMETLGR